MKPTDLKCRPQVAAVIGEVYADYELQRVIDYPNLLVKNYTESIKEAFVWSESPHYDNFWECISEGQNPYEHGHDKPELSVPESESGDKERNDGLTNKYKVLCKGVEVDVYDVLMAYGVINPADQHAIKKMLMPGKRGVKDANQDRREAIQSLERAIELAQSDK